MTDDLKYLSGFGAHHETEAVAGALPRGQNSPQVAPFGLYAEQLSLTAFTAPRAQNLRAWLYRLRPSAMHPPFRRVAAGLLRTGPCREGETGPNRLRWAPLAMPRKATDIQAVSGRTCHHAHSLLGRNHQHKPIRIEQVA